jgi:hypothetical protein
MIAFGISAVGVALAASIVAIAAPWLRRVLLGWYVREALRTEVAESPEEAIVTYPLA